MNFCFTFQNAIVNELQKLNRTINLYRIIEIFAVGYFLPTSNLLMFTSVFCQSTTSSNNEFFVHICFSSVEYNLDLISFPTLNFKIKTSRVIEKISFCFSACTFINFFFQCSKLFVFNFSNILNRTIMSKYLEEISFWMLLVLSPCLCELRSLSSSHTLNSCRDNRKFRLEKLRLTCKVDDVALHDAEVLVDNRLLFQLFHIVIGS